MKIDWIKIENIGGIHDLKLRFNSGLNLICGINGVGKTTILECIAQSFVAHLSEKVRRSSKFEEGEWKISVDNNPYPIHIRIWEFEPTDNNPFFHYDYLTTKCRKVIYIREKRILDYERIESIKEDEEINDVVHQDHLKGCYNLDLSAIKSWFIKKHELRNKKIFTENEHHNYKLVENIFTKLDDKVNYSHIEPDTYEVIVQTPTGEVYLEYLSSGFKSALFIIFNIIKQIETNFTEPRIKIGDFDGIILIDELDAHLHPSWQGTLLRILREMFPNAQIIATTHSPHIIQEANADEIIALGLTECSKVVTLEIEKSEYGFKGWTIEEILEDVMGMKDIRSNMYIETKDRFEKALREEDDSRAKESYDILLKMLHPRSPMKKIYELQLGTIGV